MKENKVDEIIEYFKLKREILYQNYLKEDYHQKQTIAITSALFGGLVALISPFIAFLFIKETSNIIFVMILIILLGVGYNIFHFVFVSFKIEKKHFTKIIKIDGILEFLWHIKISGKDKDISELIREFTKGLKDYRRVYVDNYENIQLDEFIDAMDKLNNKVELE